VDYDGYICSCVTNLDGFVHDATSATYSDSFKTLLRRNLVIGDTGFGGVQYVVAGLKANQISHAGHRHFDRISRSEQVLIEHVNNFIKKCKSVSKKNTFLHTRQHLSASVFIICGWYNFMLYYFDKGAH
jgi:hypothetical protein